MIITGLNVSGLLSGYIFTDTAMTVQHEGYLVTLDTTNDPNGVKIAGAAASIVGVITDQKIYGVGDPVSLAGYGGTIAEVIAGSAGFAKGDYVKSDASGLAVTASATDEYFGEALQTATTGNKGRIRFKAGANNSAVNPWTRAATIVRPTTAGDSIATGVIASVAKILTLLNNGITAGGTDANVDVTLSSKGTGKVLAGVIGSELPVVTTPVVGIPVISTTGTVGTAGQIAIAGLTANAVYQATLAEDPGTNLVLGYCVASTGILTVYTKNTNTDATAALSGKKVSVIVFSL